MNWTELTAVWGPPAPWSRPPFYNVLRAAEFVLSAVSFSCATGQPQPARAMFWAARWKASRRAVMHHISIGYAAVAHENEGKLCHVKGCTIHYSLQASPEHYLISDGQGGWEHEILSRPIQYIMR